MTDSQKKLTSNTVALTVAAGTAAGGASSNPNIAQAGHASAVAAPFDSAEHTGTPLTQLMHYWFSEVWSKGNLAAIAELMAPQARISGPVSSMADPSSDYGEVVTALRSLLGPIQVTFTHAMESMDWVSIRLLVNTENPRDGETFRFTGQLVARIENNKIAELFINMDYFRMFEKLGQLPPEALAICLSGEKLK